MQQLDQAVSAYQVAIRQVIPSFADTYLALGRAQRKLGQLQDALNTYRKLLRVAPNNVDACIALQLDPGGNGAICGRLRRRCGVRCCTRGTPRCRPPFTTIWRFRRAARTGMPTLWRAWSARRRWRRNCRAWTNAVSTPFISWGASRTACIFIKKLLERNPADAPLHHAYNSLLHRLGRKEEYLTSYDRAPQTREILLGKARLLSLQKRGAEVEQIYNILLARDPLDPAAAFGWAGNLMLMQGGTANP